MLAALAASTMCVSHVVTSFSGNGLVRADQVLPHLFGPLCVWLLAFGRLDIVMPFAKRLPVIHRPEPRLVAPVWDHVIHDSSLLDDSICLALLAQRILLQEQPSSLSPP